MGNISQSEFKRFRYTLRGPLGSLEISDVRGWNEDGKIFKRSTDTHGVFISLSNKLEFYRGDEKNDGGYEWLKQTDDIYGINAKVELIKEEDVSGVWEEDYRGFLDFSTYVRKEFYIELQFNESGLYEKIKARRSDAFEFGREETMDGSNLPTLSKEIAALDGRTILFISQLERTGGPYQVINSGQNRIILEDEKVTITLNHDLLGNYEAACIPITMISEQSGNVETVREYDIKESGSSYENQSTTELMFYSDSPDVSNITFDFDLEFSFRQEWSSSNIFRIDVVKFKRLPDTTFEFIESTPILTLNNTIPGSVHSYQRSYSDTTEEGSSYALAVHSTVSSSSGKFVVTEFTKVDVLVTDPSFYESSRTNFLLPYEAMERTLKIITDEDDILKSNLLGRTDLGYSENGFASLFGLTNGFWVRKFDDKPIKTSFSDFIESLNVISQAGYGIEKYGFKEYVRIEHISHFYQPFATIFIDARPKNIERKTATDYFFSSVEIGYKYPTGDNLYEEQQGLDEYNIKNKYTSVISRVEKKIELISPFSTDGYGMEFARRLSKLTNPERDTRYDQRIMLMALKRGQADIFEQTKWEDDFEKPTPFNQQTTGVYSPETATNLLLSPINLLQRWGFWLSAGLLKYPNDYVRFSESNGNSSLKTKLREDKYGISIEYSEDGKIKNSNFNKSLIDPVIISFEHPIDREMLKQIQGTITVNDEVIMNYYGQVRFINEDNQYEFGYLLSAEPNGEGKWELLRANRSNLNIGQETIIPGEGYENRGLDNVLNSATY